MADDNEKILFYVFIGIGLTLLGYLFFKDQFKTNNAQTMQLSQTQPQFQSQTDAQKINELKINELERYTYELYNQSNKLKEELLSHNNKLSNQEQLEKETHGLKEQVITTQEQLKMAQEQLNSLTQFQKYKLEEQNKSLGSSTIQAAAPHKKDDTAQNKLRQMVFNMK